MKKKLFNIHKLIGINVILFFFISLFFGIITIFQSHINFWEDPKQHIKTLAVENINLDKCIKQVTKRIYFNEHGKKMSNDFIKINFPSKEVNSSNLIRVTNRPNFYLDPNTCKKVRPKIFRISSFFNAIHTGGGIFSSIVMKIIFGFVSVAVVFLCLSGVYLVIKNSYRNTKTKTIKGFYAKYHRLLLLYTLPLVFMFGLTGALFNLGVYSSPLITNYLTDGKTLNILELERNILVDPDLEYIKLSKKAKTLDLNFLYDKAKKEFKDISFYEMQIYNYNDINARVKFVGYEPKNFFISSLINDTYIVLDGTNARILDKKIADDGSFTEKTLDAIFYLHYLRTFSDLPRIIFAFISLSILVGLISAILLWLKRSKEDKFSYKVLRPLSFTIMLGSLLSSSILFATAWLIPKSYLYINFLGSRYSSQELIFYFTFLTIFIFILIKKDLYKITKYSFIISSFLLIISVISHGVMSGYSIFSTLEKGYIEIFLTDFVLIIIALVFINLSKKITREYFIS